MRSKKSKNSTRKKKGGSLGWHNRRFTGQTPAEQAEARLLNFVFSFLPMEITNPGRERNRTVLNNFFYNAIIQNSTLDNFVAAVNRGQRGADEQPHLDGPRRDGNTRLIAYLSTLDQNQKLELCDILIDVIRLNRQRLRNSTAISGYTRTQYNNLRNTLNRWAREYGTDAPLTFDDLVFRWNPLGSRRHGNERVTEYVRALGLEGARTTDTHIRGYQYGSDTPIPRNRPPAHTVGWWQRELPNFESALDSMNRGHTAAQGYTGKVIVAAERIYNALRCRDLLSARDRASSESSSSTPPPDSTPGPPPGPSSDSPGPSSDSSASTRKRRATIPPADSNKEGKRKASPTRGESSSSGGRKRLLGRGGKRTRRRR